MQLILARLVAASIALAATIVHADDSGLQKLLDDLKSNSRETRIAAIKAISEMPSIPGSTVADLFGFAAFDTMQTIREFHPNPSGNESTIPPPLAEGISIARLRANLSNYRGTTVVLTGFITNLEDRDEYVQTTLEEVSKDGSSTGEWISPLVLKDASKGLADRFVAVKEDGMNGFGLQVKLLIPQDKELPRELICTDWRFIGEKAGTWGPWISEGLAYFGRATKRLDSSAIGPLVDLLVDQPIDQDAVINKTLVISARESLSAQNAEDLKKARKHEKRRLSATKNKDEKFKIQQRIDFIELAIGDRDKSGVSK